MSKNYRAGNENQEMKTEKQIKKRLQQVSRLLNDFEDVQINNQMIRFDSRLMSYKRDLTVKKKLLEWILK